MMRRTPRSTRPDTLFPFTTLFRSLWCCLPRCPHGGLHYAVTRTRRRQPLTNSQWKPVLTNPAKPARAGTEAIERDARIAHADRAHVAPSEIAIGVIIGRVSEFFDFFVFGLAAVLVFPRVFFPFTTQLDGTLYAFALFSLAFIARPFGSLLFRFIQDRKSTRLNSSH